MPDIGLGEVVVIAVLALLVFGPDRLPKVAADAGRALRQLRELATNARRDLADAAGLQDDGDVRTALTQLDPRQVLRSEPPRAAPAQPSAPSSNGGGGHPSASAAGGPERPAPAPDSSELEDWT